MLVGSRSIDLVERYLAWQLLPRDMPEGWDGGLGLIMCSVNSKRAREGKSEMLRETDRRNMPLPFPLLSDWCLEFESPQMWHGLTFGIWVMATGETTGETAQTELRRNVEKALLT